MYTFTVYTYIHSKQTNKTLKISYFRKAVKASKFVENKFTLGESNLKLWIHIVIDFKIVILPGPLLGNLSYGTNEKLA